MNPVRMFLPPPCNGRRNCRKDRVRVFTAMNVVLEDKRVIGRCKEVSMYTSADSRTDVLILYDSRANLFMISFISNLNNMRSINRSCTFGNKAQLRAPVSGGMPREMEARGKDALAATFKGLLRVPEVSCRLLGTKTTRRNGGGLIESGLKQS